MTEPLRIERVIVGRDELERNSPLAISAMGEARELSSHSRLHRRGAAIALRRQELGEVSEDSRILDRRGNAPSLAVGHLADGGAQRFP